LTLTGVFLRSNERIAKKISDLEERLSSEVRRSRNSERNLEEIREKLRREIESKEEALDGIRLLNASEEERKAQLKEASKEIGQLRARLEKYTKEVKNA